MYNQYKKCKYKYKTKHANITMQNLEIQVGVMETIISFIKTTTKGSKSLLHALGPIMSLIH